MKAYKASGGGQTQPAPAVETGPVETTAEPQVAEVKTEEGAAAPPAALPTDIAPPEYVEITDDLDPSDIRRARIQNAKARSAYVKQLKAAGIDPSTLDI